VSKAVRRKNPDALKEMLSRFEKAASREIAVGFPSGRTEAYPDGTSVVDVAARHVFGVGVPRRDFMADSRPGLRKVEQKFLPEMIKLSGTGLGDAEKLGALQEAAGQAAQEEIRKTIIDFNDPPNSPATIAAKGFNNPLVETSHMKDAVTYVIRKRSRKG
jgi:hypothetical protein